MENFLIRETGGSASELLIKENESKSSPQKKLTSPAKTRGIPSAEKSAPGSSEDCVPETPSTSALKQVTKGRKLSSGCFVLFYFLSGNLLIAHDIINKEDFCGERMGKGIPSLNLVTASHVDGGSAAKYILFLLIE